MISLHIFILCHILILSSLPCLSEKTYVAPCFSLKIGMSDMTCFLLLHNGYEMEVMFCLSYGDTIQIFIYDTSMLFIILANTRACIS